MAGLEAGQRVRIIGTHRHSGSEGTLIKRDVGGPLAPDYRAWFVRLPFNNTTFIVVAGEKYLEAATPIGDD